MFNITKLFLFFFTCFSPKIYTYSVQNLDYYHCKNKNNIYKILAKEKHDNTKYTYKKNGLKDIFVDLDNIKNITTSILLERILYDNNCLKEEKLVQYLDIIQDNKLFHSHYLQKYLIHGYTLLKQKKYLDSINVFLSLYEKCTNDKYMEILKFYLAYNYYKLHEYNHAYTYISDFYNNFTDDTNVKYKIKNDFNRKQLLLLMLILLNQGDNIKIDKIINIINNNKIKCDEYILTTFGDYYNRNMDYSQAINFYDQALLLTNNTTIKYNIFLKKIIANYNNGNINEIQESIEDIKKNIVQLTCTMQLQLAMLLINIDKYQDALDILQNCNNFGNKADILFLQAICYYNIHNTEKTRELLKEINDNYPQYNLINNVNMLYVYVNYDVINYNHIISKLSNNNIKCRNNNNKIITTIWQINQFINAINYYKNKKYNRSLYIAQELLKSDIENIDIYNMINLLCAEIYYIYNEYKISIHYYNKVIENTHIAKIQFMALYGLGYCYFEIKQYDKALEYFSKISFNKYYYNENLKNNIQLIIADSLLHLKEYQKAEEIYKNLKQKTIYSQYNLGIAYSKQNKNTDAMNTFKEILEKCINVPPLMYYKILYEYIKCFDNNEKRINFIKKESMMGKKFKLQDINNIIFEILKKQQETYDIDLLKIHK